MDSYEYGLPDERHRPAADRASERGPHAGGFCPLGDFGVGHATVADLPRYLRPGDVLVVNQTRVLAARLALVKPTGGAAEVLLLEPARPDPVPDRAGPTPTGEPQQACGFTGSASQARTPGFD